MIRDYQNVFWLIYFPIQKNTNVSSVDLEGNVLGAEGAAYIAEMLSQNQYITKLVSAYVCTKILAKMSTIEYFFLSLDVISCYKQL